MRLTRLRTFQLCFLLGFIALVVACSSPDLSKVEHENTTGFPGTSEGPATSTDFIASVDVIIDETALQPGDVIAGMTVESVGPFTNAPPGLQNVRIVFSGTKTVEGQFVYHGSDAATPDLVSFTVESAKGTLPVLQGDQENQTLFFTNQEQARETFGPPGNFGRATIIINGYVLERFPSNSASNKAELVEVLEIEKGANPGHKP